MDDPVQAPQPVQATTATFSDEDLVYVDPDERKVVGKVEFNATGKPKSMTVPGPAPSENGDDVKPERRRRRKFFPWGTYRSMKKIYKIEGKVREERPMLTLDEAIVKAMAEPFWD